MEVLEKLRRWVLPTNPTRSHVLDSWTLRVREFHVGPTTFTPMPEKTAILSGPTSHQPIFRGQVES